MPAKRLHKFKIITASFFGLLILFLLTLIYHELRIAKNGFVINEQVNKSNAAYASANPFGFTDRIRSTKKPKGIYRIAVLGDSFIWGDGLPYEKVWSHKLERKLLAEYDSVEVISWGKSGWSTLDEYNFFKEHGINFDIDLLIIGWVDNDPDIGKIQQVSRVDPQKKFPRLYKVAPAIADMLTDNSESDQYNNWLKQIYSSQNLKDYQDVLSEFHRYLAENNISALAVLTPGPSNFFDDDAGSRFKVGDSLFAQTNFNYLDLFVPVKKKMGHYSPRDLQVNASNGHPGDLLTEEYADDVKAYLEQNGYLSKFHKKRM